jgi:hypothetical protein
VGAQLPERLSWYASRDVQRDAAPTFVETWREWDGARVGRPIRIHPGYYVPTLFFYQAERHFRRATWHKACEPYNPCYVWNDVVFAGLDLVEDGSRYNGLIVSFDPYKPHGFASSCALLHHDDLYSVHDCRGGLGRSDGLQEEPHAP